MAVTTTVTAMSAAPLEAGATLSPSASASDKPSPSKHVADPALWRMAAGHGFIERDLQDTTLILKPTTQQEVTMYERIYSREEEDDGSGRGGGGDGRSVSNAPTLPPPSSTAQDPGLVALRALRTIAPAYHGYTAADPEKVKSLVTTSKITSIVRLENIIDTLQRRVEAQLAAAVTAAGSASDAVAPVGRGGVPQQSDVTPTPTTTTTMTSPPPPPREPPTPKYHFLSSVLDAKIGRIRYTPLVSAERRQHSINKDIGSTTESVGVRFTGLNHQWWHRGAAATASGTTGGPSGAIPATEGGGGGREGASTMGPAGATPTAPSTTGTASPPTTNSINNIISWKGDKVMGRALKPEDLHAALRLFCCIYTPQELLTVSAASLSTNFRAQLERTVRPGIPQGADLSSSSSSEPGHGGGGGGGVPDQRLVEGYRTALSTILQRLDHYHVLEHCGFTSSSLLFAHVVALNEATGEVDAVACDVRMIDFSSSGLIQRGEAHGEDRIRYRDGLVFLMGALDAAAVPL